MKNRIPFTGSYTPDDVQFLLKPMSMPDTPIHIKEALIQSGKKHYSEMLTHESLPPDDYLPLFYRIMFAQNLANQKKFTFTAYPCSKSQQTLKRNMAGL